MRHLSTRRFRSLGAARKPHDAETQVAGHNVLFRRVDHSNRGDWSPEHRGPGPSLTLAFGRALISWKAVELGRLEMHAKHDQAVRFQAWIFSLNPNLQG